MNKMLVFPNQCTECKKPVQPTMLLNHGGHNLLIILCDCGAEIIISGRDVIKQALFKDDSQLQSSHAVIFSGKTPAIVLPNQIPLPINFNRDK